MPYKSEKQRKFFNANRAKLESQGVDIDEWNESSKGKRPSKRVDPELEDAKKFHRVVRRMKRGE